ncbi:hypothetical protein SLEP1_g57192 [Rubroshorea leprosula]|uniref:Uncharacterized protein n=1 Tax=Rubroshorea leprosula TaxID=152421 RepID=A0AAV5MMW8_9ROSI|nr:hypothetical protein SLEP1_g57192 [Rubroshorea leprosula]
MGYDKHVLLFTTLLFPSSFPLILVQFPLLSRLNDAYVKLPPFQDAMPEKQPDAPPSVVS